MPRNSRRRSGGAGRSGFYWDGLQWAATAVGITDVFFVLVGGVAQEFMPSTLVRVRGNIALRGFHATQACDLQMKIMYVEITDAGAVSGDHNAIDTHEEDIAIRQLWTYTTVVAPVDEPGPNVLTIPVDIKAKVKLEPSGKKALVLVVATTLDTAVFCTGYLRCGLLHS